MPSSRKADRATRDVTINLRASRQQRVLIDRAAAALGKTRSAFMLDASCREAESVLLDRRYFAIAPETFEEFSAALDQPPATNSILSRLLAEKPPWDR